MMFLGLGSNLPGPRHAAPREVCEAAVALLDKEGLTLRRRSSWYASAPVPPSDQPWFVNGVAAFETALEPAALLARLHGVEAEFGRRRGLRNAARTLDLDLLDHGGRVSRPGALPELPHPRLAERAFVLLPLAELAPAWRHPASGRPITALLAALPPDPGAEPLEAI